ncbi:hypothetical protein [Natrinema salaciae]|uniref:Uncharacterized protein n=1 Tax=Natrinema salaciae TaxID=1186196 RepID=A0A1H9JQD6_9EURY|nr:hypothetical protein [Natrinema salaciae]SEQ89060.1 hypothetical protein SAMN04489841_2648 [Natrinema salaciae]
MTTESTGEYDIEWSEWSNEGGTGIYKRYPSKSHNWGESRPGNVEFTIDTRSNSENNRVGARTKVRMEPGRQICNSEDPYNEDYCISGSAYDGWMNRSATIYQDWDHWANGTPTDELIESYDPKNDLGDITKTRSVSLDLNLSRDPGLSVGYSSGVTIPSAQFLDKTTKTTGQTKHKFEVNGTDSNAGLYSTEFESGSVAEWDPDCGSPGGAEFVDIEIDLGWGIPNPLQFPTWQNKASDSEWFSYDRYCSPY